VLSAKGQQAVDRARAAVAPQVKGFAEDVKRAAGAIQPIAQRTVQGIANAFKFLSKVKKDYDPKTVDSLRDGESKAPPDDPDPDRDG
jgi:hypothetical protein